MVWKVGKTLIKYIIKKRSKNKRRKEQIRKNNIRVRRNPIKLKWKIRKKPENGEIRRKYNRTQKR